ncbi:MULTISPECIES: YdbL family protein [Colwellia]|uniref:DUF1318 domain-containing protein n=1 Tax=Colwellia psychrerythraea (strain 34H / ATCC BAA-681) TaxID=167879 RepID=Q47V16_COLP3|nr:MULTISPECIES: YdbL family protein [Colwellia]AAZ26890.1 hypothetical protein CPS_4712 [Colwellia psychrerythraea 34H]PKH85823.1 DUF1318 domain-containing protein [Colwellia sp. Bg11-28]
MNKLIKHSIKHLIRKVSLVLIASSIAFSAWAVTLDQAKQQGLVGEMSNGYLGVVVASTEVSDLVDMVNKKRKDIYLNLARKNKITMQQVTKLAGEKSMAKTQPGHLIQNAEGQWVKK